MQKIAQRTERATRNAAGKLAKARQHQKNAESWERYQGLVRTQRAAAQNVRDARKNRREDWEAGALAPRRDAGEQRETYGATSMYNLHAPELEPRKQPKWMHISEGDRVVVMRGREKGKIGVVDDVSKERGTVRIKGINVVDVIVPEWMNKEDNTTGIVQSTAKPMPLADVKLVYPLPDPETGIPRDVIIDRLLHVNYYYDKNKREWTDGDRLIPGTNTLIPWPEKAEPQYEDHEDDTLRITVEEQTFRPFLLHPPMPLSVIDELRNKYSKFRTRHDWEFIEQKELEDAKVEQRKELAKGMRTPLQELADVRKKQKEEADRELTEEQLARIGEVVAAERARATGAIQRMGQ
ncbi:hypothetical protein LTR85_006864 [Meristemomyces frigidus]|nr:hypothetical protein LTR85_006864 [Meristemomyces frigidus]